MTGAIFKKLVKKSASKLKPLPKTAPVEWNFKTVEKDFLAEAKKRGVIGRGFTGNTDEIPIQGKAVFPDPKTKPKMVTDVTKMPTLSFFSPSYYGDKLFTVRDNPVVQAVDCTNVWLRARQDSKEWFNAVVGKDRFGMGSFVPDNWNSISKKGLKVLEQKVEDAPVYDWYFKSLAAGKAQKKAEQAFKRNKNSETFLRLTQIKHKKELIDDKWKPAYEEYAKEVSTEFPEARVAFAAEGHKDWTWLDPLLSDKERKASTQIANYMAQKGKELRKVGIRTLNKDEMYMTHLASELPKIRDSFFKSGAGRQKMAKKLHFARRSEGSVMWFPALNQVMDYYMSTSSRKIAFQPFHDRWKPFRDTLQYKDGGQLVDQWFTKWFDGNYQNVQTSAEEKLGKIANFWVRFEYARLIGGSLSVAFKHSLKLLGTDVVHGLGATVTAAKPATKAGIQLARKTFGKGVKELGPEAELASRYIQSRVALQQMFEQPGMKAADSALEKILSNPTMAIEAMDRGMSVFATLHAGAKKGASFTDIHTGITDYIMKVNFVGGFDQLTWMRKPMARTFFMFQTTPFKIMQMRLQLAEKALRREKDIFGRSHGSQLARLFMIYGIADKAGEMIDIDLNDHIMHWPFSSHTRSGEPTLFISPTTNFALNTVREHGLSGKGIPHALAEHFSYFGTASKITGMVKDEVPEVYESEVGPGKKFRYLFGMRSIEASKEKKEVAKAWRDKTRTKKVLKRAERRGTEVGKKFEEWLAE